MELINKLADWVEEYSGVLAEKAVTLITTLANAIIKNLPGLIVAAVRIIGSLATGLIENLPMLIKQVPTIIAELVNGFVEGLPDIIDVGKQIIEGLWEGIKSMASWIGVKVSGFVGGIVDDVKGVLGIHSPSRVFAGIGGNMALGLGEGWDDKFSDVRNEIDKSLDFDDPSMSINASVHKIGTDAAGISGMAYRGNSIGNVTININGAKYSDENSLAEAMAEALQNMTDRRAAVYA